MGQSNKMSIIAEDTSQLLVREQRRGRGGGPAASHTTQWPGPEDSASAQREAGQSQTLAQQLPLPASKLEPSACARSGLLDPESSISDLLPLNTSSEPS